MPRQSTEYSLFANRTKKFNNKHNNNTWSRHLYTFEHDDDSDHGDSDEVDTRFNHRNAKNNKSDPFAEAYKSLGPLERVHYDTIHLVHEPTYAWSMEKMIKELQKIEEYNELTEFKRARKAEGSLKNKSGDEKIKELKFWLDHLGLKRHIHQIRFHEHMIRASLSKIYETEWETQYESIMKKFNIEKMKRELLFSCPRRFGKTFSVALYCAAYMLSIPNCQVAVFSTGKRTAKKLMMLILSFLSRYPGFEDHIDTKNQEDLILRFGSFDKRQLSCYPSTVKV